MLRLLSALAAAPHCGAAWTAVRTSRPRGLATTGRCARNATIGGHRRCSVRAAARPRKVGVLSTRVCRACARQTLPRRPCHRCSRTRPVAYRNDDDQPWYDGYPLNRAEPCSGCGTRAVVCAHDAGPWCKPCWELVRPGRPVPAAGTDLPCRTQRRMASRVTVRPRCPASGAAPWLGLNATGRKDQSACRVWTPSGSPPRSAIAAACWPGCSTATMTDRCVRSARVSRSPTAVRPAERWDDCCAGEARLAPRNRTWWSCSPSRMDSLPPGSRRQPRGARGQEGLARTG
jgi:hypothetical protein